MRWSFQIARVRGIPISVHLTTLIVVALVALPWAAQYGLRGGLFGAAAMILLFGCIILHELGHSLAAQRAGHTVRSILLLPIGGVATLDHAALPARDELRIAAAGPLVTVALAVVLAAGLALGGALPPPAALLSLEPDLSPAGLAGWLLRANIWLALFNLLPVFPLDGGRILRAGLALRWTHRRATAIAVRIGQYGALLLGAWAVLAMNPFLLAIAVLVYVSAGEELEAAGVHTGPHTALAADLYNRHALTLRADDRLSTAVRYVLTSYQSDFAVIHSERPIGTLCRSALVAALKRLDHDCYVTEIMDRRLVAVPAAAPLGDIRAAMARNHTRIVAVYEGERYLGLLSADDLAEAQLVLGARQLSS